MRKTLLALSCAAALYGEQMYLYEVSPIIGLMENGLSTGMESSYAYGLQLQYNNIDFLIKPELTYIFSPNIVVYDAEGTVHSHTLMANGVYDVEYTDLLTPFLKGGIGYQSVTGSSSTQINSDSFLIGAGAGLKLNLKDQFAIKFETVVTWHDFNENNILVFAGLDYAFGNEDNTPPAENATAEPVEIDTAKTPSAVTLPVMPVYISKEDLNLTRPEPTAQEIVVLDADQHLRSLTLFVPYLFRGYTLDDASKKILKGYVPELKTRNVNLTVIGHTDAKGRRAYNQELSLKRADTVKTFLVENGIDKERITVEGRGESEPFARPNDPAADQLNQRIEIKVTD